jgi:hypothetical protein
MIAKERNGALFLGHDLNWVSGIRLIPEYYD